MSASLNPRPDSQPKSAFSWKGLLVGSLFSLFIGIAAPYGAIILQGSWWGFNSSSPGAICSFFVLTFGVNVLVGLIGRQHSLKKADLVMVYAMLLMAVSVSIAFVGYLIPHIRRRLLLRHIRKQLVRDLLSPHPEMAGAAGLRSRQGSLRRPASRGGHSLGGLDETAGLLVRLLPGAQLHHDLHGCGPAQAVVAPRAARLSDDAVAPPHDRGNGWAADPHPPILQKQDDVARLPAAFQPAQPERHEPLHPRGSGCAFLPGRPPALRRCPPRVRLQLGLGRLLLPRAPQRHLQHLVLLSAGQGPGWPVPYPRSLQ